MFRLLFKLALLVIVVGAVAGFLIASGWTGSRANSDDLEAPDAPESRFDVDRARQTGAEILDRVTREAGRAEQVLTEAGLTAKIKSKMALDDTLDSSRVSVETSGATSGATVIVTGSVGTTAEHARALQLVRETAGVTTVVDRLEVREP